MSDRKYEPYRGDSPVGCDAGLSAELERHAHKDAEIERLTAERDALAEALRSVLPLAEDHAATVQGEYSTHLPEEDEGYQREIAVFDAAWAKLAKLEKSHD